MRILYDADCTTARLDPDEPLDADLIATLSRALSYVKPGAVFTPEFKRGLWDGRVKFFDEEDLSFPAGLARRVRDILAARDITPEIIDERPDPPWPPDIALPDLAGVTLFDDQKIALAALLANPRGCLQFPTGGGKSLLAAALAKAARPARVLFIVDRKSLAGQTLREFRAKLQETIGIAGGGFSETTRRVTVATIQYLWHHRKRLQRTLFPEIRLLLVDEAHEMSEKTWRRTLDTIPAPARIGLSATIREAPKRMLVEALLGPLVHEVSDQELVAAGRQPETRVSFLRCGGLVSDLDDVYMRGVVRNEHRNRLVIDAVLRAIKAQWPFLILLVRIEHGQFLARELSMRGVNIPFLWGQTPIDVIERAKRDLQARRLPGIMASTIMDKGHDLPNVRLVILAGAGRADHKTIQRIGRGRRLSPDGDPIVDVLDFWDMSHRSLQSQARDRFNVCKRKGYKPEIRDMIDVFPRPRREALILDDLA